MKRNSYDNLITVEKEKEKGLVQKCGNLHIARVWLESRKDTRLALNYVPGKVVQNCEEEK